MCFFFVKYAVAVFDHDTVHVFYNSNITELRHLSSLTL